MTRLSRLTILRAVSALGVIGLGLGLVPGGITGSWAKVKKAATPVLTSTVTVSAAKTGYATVRLAKPLTLTTVDGAAHVTVTKGSAATFGGIALLPDATQYRTAGLTTVPAGLFLPHLAGRPAGEYPAIFVGVESNGTAASQARQLAPGSYRLHVFSSAPITVTLALPGLTGKPVKIATALSKNTFATYAPSALAGPVASSSGSFATNAALPSTGVIFDALWYQPTAEAFHDATMCLYQGGGSAQQYAAPWCPGVASDTGVSSIGGGVLFANPVFGQAAGTWGNQLAYDSLGEVSGAGGAMFWVGG